MANARQSILEDRRGESKIRLLAPVATGISSIAKQNASNETDIMVAKYNAGLIGNEEMKAFLQTQLGNQYVSASDKTQIQTKLLDFDVLIEKDRLESVFKLAPENSLQKAQAATALADFYQKRASTMVAGTQAHSQALENAGVWQQNLATIQESTNREQQKNYKNQMLEQVNKLTGSAKAQASAEMYTKLYDLAMQQGDQEGAQVYAANKEQELSRSAAYQESEANQAASQNRKDIINEFNIVKNAYLTKQISYDEYKKYLIELNDYAMEQQDGTLQTSVISAATEMEKLQAKGGPGAVNIGGNLFAKTKSTGGGSSVADKMSQDYSDNLRVIQEMYINGNDGNGNPYTEQDYKEDLAEAVGNRTQELDTFWNTVQSMDDSATVWWKGKNRKVRDVKDEIEKEYNNVNSLNVAIESGTVMLKQLPVSEQIGKNLPTYELIDWRNIDDKESHLLALDERGIFHTGEMSQTEITKEARESLLGEDYERKDISYDGKTGKYYQYSGIVFDVVDDVTGQNYKQVVNPDGKLQSVADIRRGAKEVGYGPRDIIDYNPEQAEKVQTAVEAGEVRTSMTK